MAIKSITLKSIKRKHKREKTLYGLVILGCINDLEKTIEFMNGEWEEAGIFTTDARYKPEDCLQFEFEGKPALIYPFLEHIPLNLDNFAIWRMNIRPICPAMWVEDFVANYLKDL